MPKEPLTEGELERDLDFFKARITHDDAVKALMVLSHETGTHLTGPMGPWPVVFDIQRRMESAKKLFDLKKLLKEIVK